MTKLLRHENRQSLCRETEGNVIVEISDDRQVSSDAIQVVEINKCGDIERDLKGNGEGVRGIGSDSNDDRLFSNVRGTVDRKCEKGRIYDTKQVGNRSRQITTRDNTNSRNRKRKTIGVRNFQVDNVSLESDWTFDIENTRQRLFTNIDNERSLRFLESHGNDSDAEPEVQDDCFPIRFARKSISALRSKEVTDVDAIDFQSLSVPYSYVSQKHRHSMMRLNPGLARKHCKEVGQNQSQPQTTHKSGVFHQCGNWQQELSIAESDHAQNIQQ